MRKWDDVLQTCRKCGETKPNYEFDLRSDTGKYRTECKSCRRVYQRAPLDPSRTRTRWLVGTGELLPCRTCGQLKASTEFPRRSRTSHRLQTWCKECFSAYKAERHRKNHDREMRRIRRNQEIRLVANRALVAEYLLAHPCVDCGETDRAVLEFDHVRGVKVGDVSAMVKAGYPWAKIEAEIAKCDVRCANCHRRVTNRRRETGIGGPSNLPRQRPRRDSNARPTPSKGAALSTELRGLGASSARLLASEATTDPGRAAVRGLR